MNSWEVYSTDQEIDDIFEGKNLLGDDDLWAQIEPYGRKFYVTVGYGYTNWGPDGGGWFARSEAKAKDLAGRKIEELRATLIQEKNLTQRWIEKA